MRLYACAGLSEVASEKSVPACLTRFAAGSAIFRNGTAAVAVGAPKDWTHAAVELLGLEKTRGLYSPGHNPFWFKNDGRTRLAHTFRFTSQENPITDVRQAQLAAKFAPIMVFHARKRFLPSNLEQYHKTHRIVSVPAEPLDRRRLWQSDPVDKHIVLPEPSLKQAASHLYYHVRPADATVSGTQPHAPPGFRDDANYWYGGARGDVVISFWIWYDWNDGPTSYGNTHQGDLESLAILVDANGQPKRFMHTGHDHIMLDTAWHNINSLNHHPIVYVAAGNKGADGGNPNSAYGGYEARLDAGNAFFTWLSDPRDIFPSALRDQVKLIVPEDVSTEHLRRVQIGPDAKTHADLSARVAGRFVKLVKWEEPNWINQPADRDPDGHHRVAPAEAWFLGFHGRIGKHPESRTDYLRQRRFGRSPENAPYKTNIEQHFTFEKPRVERHYEKGAANYGPRFTGTKKTPQFVR